jgi:hypothetical protein
VPNVHQLQTSVCASPPTRHGVRALDRDYAASRPSPARAFVPPRWRAAPLARVASVAWPHPACWRAVPRRTYRACFLPFWKSFCVCVCIRVGLIGEGPGLLAKKGRCYTLPRSAGVASPLFAVSGTLEGDGLRGRCRGAFLFICPRLRGLFPSVGAREGRVHSSADTDHARRLDEGQGNRHPRAHH